MGKYTYQLSLALNPYTNKRKEMHFQTEMHKHLAEMLNYIKIITTSIDSRKLNHLHRQKLQRAKFSLLQIVNDVGEW